MKTSTLFLTFIALIGSISAQTPAPVQPLFIKGTMNIAFNTKQSPPGTKGITDAYNLDINVSDSVHFHGKILDQPQIIEGVFSKAITQPRLLKYDLACDVVNPKNVTQVKNIGRMFGNVPITSDGVYDYNKSDLVIDILPIGNAAGFTSKFTGQAEGKPLVRPSNWADTLRQAVNITKLVNGRLTIVTLKKYDKLHFSQVVLAQGPVQIYQAVTLNGEMLFDYDKNCWFFNGFTVQYTDGTQVKIDRITGTIRWVEDTNRKANGLGHYDTDIRVNEPIQDSSAAFSAPTDESDFFSSSATIPGITGTLNYKDTVNSAGDTTASAVTIDLTGNTINKQQLMVLAKVIIFAAVIPMNSD